MHKDRALWVTLGVFALAFAAYSLREDGRSSLAWLPSCLFHKYTGLNCPGCGMTRAAEATLHGRFAEAFRYNPVGMILFPLACAGIAFETLGWVRGKSLPFRLNTGAIGAQVILWIIIAFWVLRNIPCWPFTLLSPP